MKKSSFIITISTIAFIFSCSKPINNESFAPTTDSTAVASDESQDKVTVEKAISSSAAKENPADKTHRFIRTADLRFRVKNVVRSTYEIEDITSRMGGFVTLTDLKSSVNSTHTSPVGKDSLLETTRFTVHNSMTIRVPNTRLDTTLKQIAKVIEFLDSRVIKADDVSLQMLSNHLAAARSAKSQNRLVNAIDKRGKKLGETVTAEETLNQQQEAADNATIDNLSLNDRIQFSTIEIEMYQPESIKREVIANIDNNDSFEPGFFSRVGDALDTGWYAVKEIIIFLFSIWWLIALLAAAYIFYRQVKRKKE